MTAGRRNTRWRSGFRLAPAVLDSPLRFFMKIERAVWKYGTTRAFWGKEGEVSRQTGCAGGREDNLAPQIHGENTVEGQPPA